MSGGSAWSPPGAEEAIDALGLRCPLPVIKLEAALRRAREGALVAIRTDDPVATVDIPHAARAGGHACERAAGGPPFVFLVTRRGAPPAPSA